MFLVLLQGLQLLMISRLSLALLLSQVLHPFILHALHLPDPLVPLLHLLVPVLLCLVYGLLLLLLLCLLEAPHLKQGLVELHQCIRF